MALQAGQFRGGLAGVMPRELGAPLGRTPWVDKTMHAVWQRTAAKVRPEWMPQLEESSRKKIPSVAEFGCGLFGCALPTHEPGIVLKLTSDASEALFAKGAMDLGEWPDGMVRYYEVLAVAPDQKRRSRNLFLLWREEAHDIGFIFNTTAKDGYEQRARNALHLNLNLTRVLAARLEQIIKKSKNRLEVLSTWQRHEQWAYDAGQEAFDLNAHDQIVIKEPPSGLSAGHRIAFYVRALSYITETMENLYLQDELGRTLSFYLGHGIVLGDVHLNNVGKATRDGTTVTVITDPGLAVPIDPKWLTDIQIQVV